MRHGATRRGSGRRATGTRAGDLLRRVDHVAVPPLGDALHRLIRGPSRLRRVLLVAGTGGLLLLTGAVWVGGRLPTRDQAEGEVVRVGVPEGSSIPGYVADSGRELASLVAVGQPEREMYALVTLSAYLAPERLVPVVDGLAVSVVFARVPLPHTPTEIVRIDAFRVPEDVLAGMEQVALRKDGQALDYYDLSAKLTGQGDQERRLRAEYENGARVALAEAEAYRRRCSCVYAVIVRATPAQLSRIAERSEVRAVDPAPQVSRLDRAVFLPPLPEQADLARQPEDPHNSNDESPDRRSRPDRLPTNRVHRHDNASGIPAGR